LPVRAAPADYQSQAKAGTVTIAADFTGHGIPNSQEPLNSEDYVAVEVGLFGPPDARLTIASTDFSLRINGKKAPLPSQPWGLVAKEIKDRQEARLLTAHGGSDVLHYHLATNCWELTAPLAGALVDLQRQRALADRSRGLERLLELRDQSTLKTTAAEIIAGAATPDFRTVTIDKGTRDGLRADMAVIAPAGVVGRVVVASGRAAKVQLLIDRNAAAGAIVERSRAQGVVVGGGDERLRMEYVSEAADIVVGDAVMTSGIDGIYPKGFVIGKVEAVEKNGPAYKRIVVRPAVDFRALEEVLAVLTPVPRETAGSTE
jgi:rod shape-determining protein MreC